MLELGAPVLVGVANNNVNVDFSVEETALYWLAVQAEGVGGFGSAPERGGGLFRVRSNIPPVGEGLGWGYQVTGQVPGSLADPFPASPTPRSDGPLIYLRVANAPPPLSGLERHRSPWAFWGLNGEDTTVTFGALTPGAAPTFAGAADTCYAMPIYLQMETSLEKLTAAVMTLDADGNFWMGIYDANDDGYPRQLLEESGSIAMAIIGVKTHTTANILRPGLYWLAIQTDGNVDVGVFSARRMDGLCQFAVAASASYPDCGLTVASVSAGMPDPFPPGASGAQLLPGIVVFALSKGQELPTIPRLPAVINHIYHEGWYVAPSMYPWGATQTKLLHVNTMSCIPVVLDRETTFDQFWVDVQTAPSAPVPSSMGIYEDNGGYKPGRLLLESATQNITLAGINRFSLTFTLSPGLYWLAVQIGPAGPAAIDLRAQDGFAYQQGWSGDVNPVFCWRKALPGVPPMPDPFDGTSVAPDPPLMGMRVKHYGPG